VYVSRLQIEGIRGFHGGRSVDLAFDHPGSGHAGWTVLAGRNGSGKTTLLRALALAISVPEVVYQSGTDLTDWPTDRDQDGRVRVILDNTDFNETEWLLEGQPAPLRERVLAGRSHVEAVCTWAAGRRKPQWKRAIVCKTGPASGESVQIDDDVWEVLLSDVFCFEGYGPFRRLSREWRHRVSTERFGTLFSEDAVLADGIAWLMRVHLHALEKRPGADELLRAALVLLGDGLLPDGYHMERFDSDGLWVVHDGREIPLTGLSDGFRTTVALVTHMLGEMHRTYGLPDVMDHDRPVVSSPAVVLIDEADAHLHVSWQQRIGDWLKAHFPRVQFIVTTHSPYICQSADPGGLIRLAGPDENEPPRVVDEDLYRRIVYGSGDDAVLSDLFGLDSPYSERAEQLRRRLGDLEGRVLAGQASDDELAEYETLSRTLTSSVTARVDEVAARLARRFG
jgi:hypothetical protein